MKQPVRQFLKAMVFSFLTSLFLFPLIAFSGDSASEWKAPERAARRKNPIPADEKSIEAGRAVYTKECYSCHGAAGKGDGPAAIALERSPGDLSSPKMWEQTDGALFWKISTGKKPMASFETILTEEQRWNVVNYIRTLAPRQSDK
jgi:mono/diheme cytochrome c family protein